MRRRAVAGKVLAVFLCFVMLFAYVPFSALAEDGTGGGTSDPTTPTEPTSPSIADFEVGSGSDPSNVYSLSTQPLTISTKGETVQLGAIVWWNDGTATTPGDARMSVQWTSSDPSIATVDTGVVSPVSDGTVTITATGTTDVEATCALSASITITFENQSDAAYATGIQLYREDGTPVSTEGDKILFEDRGASYTQMFYAEVTFSDGTIRSSLSAADKANVTFQLESDDVADVYYPGSGMTYVWASDDGGDGTTQLLVSATGGQNNQTVSISVPIEVDTGAIDNNGLYPQDELTVRVYWEDDPNPDDPTIKEYTYSLDELDQMSTSYATYTIIQDPTQTRKYAYQTARGVYLVDLLYDCGVYPSDVKRLDVVPADEDMVSSSSLGTDFFLGYRFYYPYYYSGRKTSDAVAVPAMIAVAAITYWNCSAETKAEKVDTYADLESPNNTRFRLCIGAQSGEITGGKFSIRNINTINVVLAGAPPVDNNTDPGGGGGGDGSGTGNGGSGGGSSTGTGTGTGAGTGSGDQAGSSNGGNAGANFGGFGSSSDDTSAGSGGGDVGGNQWNIYEMVSTAKTDLPIDVPDNPAMPFVLPLADIMVLAGIMTTVISYKREKTRGKVLT